VERSLKNRLQERVERSHFLNDIRRKKVTEKLAGVMGISSEPAGTLWVRAILKRRVPKRELLAENLPVHMLPRG